MVFEYNTEGLTILSYITFSFVILIINLIAILKLLEWYNALQKIKIENTMDEEVVKIEILNSI